MKKGEFLLEIGCEDLPEWTGDYFRERWLPLLTGELKKARIDHGDLEFFTTPRRLVVFIREMNLYQEALVEEVTGPPVSAGYDASGCPTAAAIGFARAHGVRVEKLIQKEHRGRKVLVAVKHVPGVATRKVIVAVVTESLMKMEIPRAMSWGDKRFRFVRPVRWVLLLLDGRPVPGELFGLKIGRKTCGHRIRHPESFSVVSISDYLKRVREHRVILDLDARREKIVSSLKESIPAESSFDPAAVEQACRLAEDPIVVMGKVPDEFHSLPLEVIEAVVNKLKAIPIRDSRGCVCFGLVLEGVNNDVVRQNYEKVLADRLEDARFFLSQDAHKPLKAYQEDLRRIVYHPRWGSVFDRVERFQAMAMVAAEKIPLRDQQRENLIAAVNLCKNDLATQMVAEFPALQGVIGRIYASREGYPEEVSLAIEQHYWPRGAADRIPETMTGAIVAVIDRLESFCCFFLEGEEISGAGDPFGLKRAASGLVEIIWGRKLSLPLAEMIEAATKMLKPEAAEKVREAVLNFIRQRADSLLAGEGIPAGIRRAVLKVENNLVVVREKIEALREFLKLKESEGLLVGFTRVANILKQAREKGLVPGVLDPAGFQEKAEVALYRLWKEEEVTLREIYQQGDYAGFLRGLQKWRTAIDSFFDEVLVMCPQEELCRNRLSLLQQVNKLFLLMADFSYISPEELSSHASEN